MKRQELKIFLQLNQTYYHNLAGRKQRFAMFFDNLWYVVLAKNRSLGKTIDVNSNRYRSTFDSKYKRFYSPSGNKTRRRNYG